MPSDHAASIVNTHRGFVQPAAVPQTLCVFSEVNDLLFRSSRVEACRLVVVTQIPLRAGARLIAQKRKGPGSQRKLAARMREEGSSGSNLCAAYELDHRGEAMI